MRNPGVISALLSHLKKRTTLFLGLLFLTAVFFPSNPVLAQTNGVLTPEISNLLSQGYEMRIIVDGIGYRYYPAGEAVFARKEVKDAHLLIALVKANYATRRFEKTITLNPGERIIDQLMIADGHLETQAASFIFYGDEQGLGTILRNIPSAQTTIDTAGRILTMNIDGFWVNNPDVPVHIERSEFRYDQNSRLLSYFSRLIILDNSSGLPGGQMDALVVQRIDYNPSTNKPQRVTYSHFYGPGQLWTLGSLYYNKDGEVVRCSLKATAPVPAPLPTPSPTPTPAS